MEDLKLLTRIGLNTFTDKAYFHLFTEFYNDYFMQFKDKEIKNFKHECTIDGNVKYKDIVSTAKIIYKENGFLKGFLRGMLPRVICNAPCCAISWGTYEFIKYHLLKFKLNGIYHPHI